MDCKEQKRLDTSHLNNHILIYINFLYLSMYILNAFNIFSLYILTCQRVQIELWINKVISICINLVTCINSILLEKNSCEYEVQVDSLHQQLRYFISEDLLDPDALIRLSSGFYDDNCCALRKIYLNESNRCGVCISNYCNIILVSIRHVDKSKNMNFITPLQVTIGVLFHPQRQIIMTCLNILMNTVVTLILCNFY